MFHLELGVDFDRGFSSGFSPPDIFLPFSVFAHAHKASKSVAKSVSFHRKTQDKKFATKSVAKSDPLGRKIHRKIRHSHQKNPLQFHSAETCALQEALLRALCEPPLAWNRYGITTLSLTWLPSHASLSGPLRLRVQSLVGPQCFGALPPLWLRKFGNFG